MSRTTTLRGAFTLAIYMLLSMSISGVAYAQAVYNVVYNNNSGAFIKLNGDNWVEKNRDGTHNFTELSSNNSSVYLQRGNVRIHLDLANRNVNYKNGNSAYRKLYSITDTNRDTGWSVSRVPHSGSGAFVQNSHSSWVQYKPGVVNRFTEVLRDKWSVYMKHNHSNRRIQLDLYTKQVKDWNTQQELHKITSGSTAGNCINRKKNSTVGRYRGDFGARAKYTVYANCEPGGAAIGVNAGADVRLFKKDFDAAKVETKVKTNYGNFKISGLGNVILNLTVDEPLSFAFPVYGPKAKKTFKIAGIAGFKVEARAGIVAGVKNFGPLVGATNDSLILGLLGEPFINASAAASGTVDIAFAGIWARSGLTLAELGLPSELAVWINGKGKLTDFWGTTSLRTTLLSDGNLSAGGFVRPVPLPFVPKIELTFFSLDTPTAWTRTFKIY